MDLKFSIEEQSQQHQMNMALAQQDRDQIEADLV